MPKRKSKPKPKYTEHIIAFEKMGLEMVTDIKLKDNCTMIGANRMSSCIQTILTMTHVNMNQDFFVKFTFTKDNQFGRPVGEWIVMNFDSTNKAHTIECSLPHVNSINTGLCFISKPMGNINEMVTISLNYSIEPFEAVEYSKLDLSGQSQLLKKRKIDVY